MNSIPPANSADILRKIKEDLLVRILSVMFPLPCEASQYKNPLCKTAGRKSASISEGSKDHGRSIVRLLKMKEKQQFIIRKTHFIHTALPLTLPAP
jgi:hypothetical protein